MEPETGIVSRVNEWMAHPFNAQGSVSDWFFFVGLVAVAAFLWARIIRDFEDAI